MSKSKKIELLNSVVEKWEKNIRRQGALEKELENDEATLVHISTLVSLEPDSHYTSLEEWKNTINKQITRGRNSLENIETKKVLVEAVKYYITHNEG